MIHKIQNEYASAEIDSFGAELKSYKDKEGTEFIWHPYDDFWKGTSPILFPIVGRLRNGTTIIEGNEYNMDIHGFAKDTKFEVESRSESSITFVLDYSEETLRVYPYKFKFFATFTLENSKLITKFDVKNIDDKPIIFGIGGHTAFKCPIEESYKFEDYVLEFPEVENAHCPYVDEKGMILSNHRRIILDNTNILHLNHSMFSNDALIFDDIKSKSVKFYNEKTGNGIVANFNDYRYIAFWTQNDMNAPFICVEPWNGMGNCEDESDNFHNKRGIVKLAEGQDYSAVFDFDFIPMNYLSI